MLRCCSYPCFHLTYRTTPQYRAASYYGILHTNVHCCVDATIKLSTLNVSMDACQPNGSQNMAERANSSATETSPSSTALSHAMSPSCSPRVSNGISSMLSAIASMNFDASFPSVPTVEQVLTATRSLSKMKSELANDRRRVGAMHSTTG